MATRKRTRVSRHRTKHEIRADDPATVSGPSGAKPASDSIVERKRALTEELAEHFPFNRNKEAEFSEQGVLEPGASASSPDPLTGASTVSEGNAAPKAGTVVRTGQNPTTGSLDRVRVDSAERGLTTNQGVQVADNQNTLKAGRSGPALLEDFIFREKITHFDHERIPERVVHARGSGAHGYFECYKPLTEITAASLFAEAGKKTPVFVRFSTVAGERGSTDTARDVRGFAVKFYTDQGNWDLVGNNIPVFFIQDAIKFPDVIHAVKPEPHHAMPQAASAHDTFWDFVSLMPESTHMLMWVMSDRAIPRSYRMMQGFGVHTFRFVNAAGESTFVKFHWSPVAGTHSLLWDEAVKISGADSDFHRRDLWEAIEAGAYPQWELGVQLFDEEKAQGFSFDVLDPTKLIPEELIPLRPIGRMVLNRNPDNFFAETEQVAFCTAHVVPGIDFSNDPLLAGRIHSYVDTQISRLGGPNFHEIPINAPLAAVHNNQRDGMHRQAIARGQVAYEPNSLAGGCPFQVGATGFRSFPQPLRGDKVRAKPEKFAEHYQQATLFWRSQAPHEQNHIVGAFRFELSKVQTNAVRNRVVAQLRNVAEELAERVAGGLGLPALPEALPILVEPSKPEVTESRALSLLARPGTTGIATRRVAVLVGEGSDVPAAHEIVDQLQSVGAVPRIVSSRLGRISHAEGEDLEVESSVEISPAVLWDGVIIPGGTEELLEAAPCGQVLEFLKDQYRHCKPILAFGQAVLLLQQAGIETKDRDSGLLVFAREEISDGVNAFADVLHKHRIFARESDPPRI